MNGLFIPPLMYGREKERVRIRAVQIDDLKGLLDIRRTDQIPRI